MQLRADLQLQTAIRALSEVVAPALDPDNGMASEQLQLVIGMLHLMAAQLPLQARYDRDELSRLLEFSYALSAAVDVDGHSQIITTLMAANVAASVLLSQVTADPADILPAIRALRTHTGALITAVYRDSSDTARSRITALVLAHAEQQLLRERAWLAPMGWESRPADVPAIIDLLK
jgi:hypothetical protein